MVSIGGSRGAKKPWGDKSRDKFGRGLDRGSRGAENIAGINSGPGVLDVASIDYVWGFD